MNCSCLDLLLYATYLGTACMLAGKDTHCFGFSSIIKMSDIG